MTPDPVRRGALPLLRTREFGVALAFVGAAWMLAYALLGLLSATSSRLLFTSLREWRPVSSLEADPARYFEGLQPELSAERTFHVVVRLERAPRQGDFFGIERELHTEADAAHCLEVYVSRHREAAGAVSALGLQIFARVNGEPVASRPFPQPRRAELLSLTDLRPRDGRITLILGVLATTTYPVQGWERRSEVHFRLAWLGRCR